MKTELLMQFMRDVNPQEVDKYPGFPDMMWKLFEEGEVLTTISVDFGGIGEFLSVRPADNKGLFKWELSQVLYESKLLMDWVDKKIAKEKAIWRESARGLTALEHLKNPISWDDI